MPWDFWLIVVFLGVVIPWRGRMRLKRLLLKPQVSAKEKIALYGGTIAFQWAALVVVAWRAIARGMTAEDLALARPGSIQVVILSVAGAIVIGALHWLNLRRIAKIQAPAVDEMRSLAAKILPLSLVEFLPYAALAITAGVCEEFLYRGFLLGALERAGWRIWIVVIFTSLLFGLAHAYQGRGGVIGTMLLGLLLAVIRVTYDSLLPVVVWHSVVDLVAGVAGPRYLLQRSILE